MATFRFFRFSHAVRIVQLMMARTLRINEDERSHSGLEAHPERQTAVSRD
jgi:hypothetical protein